LSYVDQCKDLTELRAEFAEYRNINAQSQQVTLKRVDLAFNHYFRRLKAKEGKAGFPRFKSVERFSGFGYKAYGDGWALAPSAGNKHRKLRLSGLGLIKMRGKARTAGQPKTLEILHENGRWYASVTISCYPTRVRGNKAASIDWGITTFATIVFDDETVEQIENPRHIRTNLKELKRAHREVKPTQTCSECGRQAKKELSERRHECECGARLDRDENAAKVILLWGVRQRVNGRGPAMCGAEAMAFAAKHKTPSMPQVVGW
jgi:putative transposase